MQISYGNIEYRELSFSYIIIILIVILSKNIPNNNNICIILLYRFGDMSGAHTTYEYYY